MLACFGHMLFNGLSSTNPIEALMVPWYLALALVGVITISLIVSVVGNGQVIRARLTDYQRAGWLTPREVELFGGPLRRTKLLAMSVLRGPKTWWYTTRLVRRYTELAYLRDKMVRGTVGAPGDDRAHEILHEIEHLGTRALNDYAGLPIIPKRKKGHVEPPTPQDDPGSRTPATRRPRCPAPPAWAATGRRRGDRRPAARRGLPKPRRHDPHCAVPASPGGCGVAPLARGLHRQPGARLPASPGHPTRRPLLAVVGGSTGAGKSTLVNSLLRAEVTRPGVLRPTTKSPVLVCHPDDEAWFRSEHVLPDLVRTDTQLHDSRALHIVAFPDLPPGLALLDAPDIDSVDDANRSLAGQLLLAADLWLFVTSAARYADAVPWAYLASAAERNIVVSVVVNRCPPGALTDVAGTSPRCSPSAGSGPRSCSPYPNGPSPATVSSRWETSAGSSSGSAASPRPPRPGPRWPSRPWPGRSGRSTPNSPN
ncbi:hypothetical protein G7085_17270 [Tessaracoccus sp. HDW20]|uniref:hypothetical protein n=1 Tax=Tessaracoccus coleopterorum TaxID=2714950 RepID=UPI0018D2B571|nr:hypothetical protein [Tessaracoccus coleopterorum]NHB85742.1 hypothetical protein [Tessaracoccus coleopterorum]